MDYTNLEDAAISYIANDIGIKSEVFNELFIVCSDIARSILKSGRANEERVKDLRTILEQTLPVAKSVVVLNEALQLYENEERDNS